MLESLHISNYALIDTLDLQLAGGFNVITGETGAGKSIILGALGLLMGARADTRVVADPAVKSVIEAVFTVDGMTALRDYCVASDIEWDDERCILRREILPSGRSRAFVNDSPVPLANLREVAVRLVDIHSQHQNQLLASPEFQLSIIDTLAGNGDRLREYASRWGQLREAARRLKAMRLKVEREKEDEEYTRFQLEQIEELNLQEGEQQALEEERDVQSNLSDIKHALGIVSGAIAQGEENALDLLGQALSECDRLESVLPADESIPERLESARIEISDIADSLSRLDETLQADPARLQYIEERLGNIYSLCHKHHVDTSDDLIALRDRLREKLSALDNSDALLGQLEREARRAKSLAKETALEISEARKAEAVRFAALLTDTAMPLGMKNLRVEVEVLPAEMSATGIDSVQFLAAFNKNQPLMPVGSTASGGEISRLMLSIKSIVASRMQLPSIIFDEVDTGVSGEIADRMGAMMQQIARNIQVTAITHLPQVAARGNAHYTVYKEDDAQSTHTRIRSLTPDERVNAIAAMLAGANVDKTAVSAARALLNRK